MSQHFDPLKKQTLQYWSKRHINTYVRVYTFDILNFIFSSSGNSWILVWCRNSRLISVLTWSSERLGGPGSQSYQETRSHTCRLVARGSNTFRIGGLFRTFVIGVSLYWPLRDTIAQMDYFLWVVFDLNKLRSSVKMYSKPRWGAPLERTIPICQALS